MNCPHHCDIQRATLVVQRFTKIRWMVLFTDTAKRWITRADSRTGIYSRWCNIFCTQNN
jgi:hypothetical protein